MEESVRVGMELVDMFSFQFSCLDCVASEAETSGDAELDCSPPRLDGPKNLFDTGADC